MAKYIGCQFNILATKLNTDAVLEIWKKITMIIDIVTIVISSTDDH